MKKYFGIQIIAPEEESCRYFQDYETKKEARKEIVRLFRKEPNLLEIALISSNDFECSDFDKMRCDVKIIKEYQRNDFFKKKNVKN